MYSVDGCRTNGRQILHPLIEKKFLVGHDRIKVHVIVARGSHFAPNYEKHVEELVRDLKMVVDTWQGPRMKGERQIETVEKYGWAGGETVVVLRVIINGNTENLTALEQFCSDAAYALAYRADLKHRGSKDRIYRFMY